MFCSHRDRRSIFTTLQGSLNNDCLAGRKLLHNVGPVISKTLVLSTDSQQAWSLVNLTCVTRTAHVRAKFLLNMCSVLTKIGGGGCWRCVLCESNCSFLLILLGLMTYKFGSATQNLRNNGIGIIHYLWFERLRCYGLRWRRNSKKEKISVILFTR